VSPRALLVLVTTAAALPAYAGNDPLLADTARTLPAGHRAFGVFAPLRWGLTDSVELATHPLWDFVAPGLDVKVGWTELEGFELASEHGISYPTPLMRLLSRSGTGGIVPADVKYPHIIATSHHLLVTRDLGGPLVTLRAGGRLAKNLTAWDGPRFWSEVEWHFVRPRTAAWFTGWSVDAGLAVEGPVRAGFGYRVELDGYLMPGLRGDKAAEWAALATWRRGDSLQVRAGLLWSYCEFPYGSRVSVPLPLLDVVWALGG
jgi:hypothetical protein